MLTPPEPHFLLEPFEPAYVALAASGELTRRATRAMGALEECRLCPRRCGVNRRMGEVGFCQVGRLAPVASAFAHPGEEDCLRGWHGSGTIFLGGCNLHCAFCQNCDISQGRLPEESTPEDLASIMLALERRGCHNINLVTPSHVVPQLLEGIARAVSRGLGLPIVYNTSAYDAVETLRLLDGVVDIYMPDFKFWEPGTGDRLAVAPDYPETARLALREMHRQVGVLRMSPEGLARRGVLVRHLVMPGQEHESEAILSWLATELSPDTFVNVMGQYRPAHRVGRRDATGERQLPEIDRRPSTRQLRETLARARGAGLWRFDTEW